LENDDKRWKHIDHKGVTADPARVKSFVDIADGGEGVGGGAGRIEIPVHVVRRACSGAICQTGRLPASNRNTSRPQISR